MSKKQAEEIYDKLLRMVIARYGKNITSDSDLAEMLGRYRVKNVKVLPKTAGLKALASGYRGGLIVNTMDAPGEHWTVFYNFGDKILFYDSFGRTAKELFGVITKNTEKDVEQGKSEYNCGQRSVVFCIICQYFGYDYAKWI